MINPGALAFDIAGNAVGVALPAILWAGLFLLAFERSAFASSIGLGRRAFWLLLPGALAALLADLPLFPYTNDWVGVSLAGGLFPILVAVLAFQNYAPPARRSLGLYLVPFAITSGLLFAAVVLLPPVLGHPGSGASVVDINLAVAALAASAPLVVGLLAYVRHDDLLRRVALLLALTGGVVAVTFVFSSAIPGIGISESFPQYLVAPIAAGVVAVWLAPRLLPGSEGLALPAAFISSTFGVLIGADLLREPPLYPSAGPGFYVIGGAGVLDLVYLSGLLGLLAALATHRLLGRGWAPIGPPADTSPSPVGRLARGFRLGVRGDLPGSLRTGARAAHDAAAQARLLLGISPAPADRPWEGLPVPGWVVSDHANLDAAARAGTGDGREGYRTWLTARYMVVIARELGARRFATATSRAAAFALDLGVVTAPAVLLWAYVALSTPGGYTGLAGSAPFNASLVGYIAATFLYFVVAETVFGTTVGKYALGLQVRERGLRPVGVLPSLVRNSFKVPSVSVVAFGAAIGTALLIDGVGGASPVVDGIPIPVGVIAALGFAVVVAIGLALVGLVGFVTIAVTAERQRWGDIVAGTWVVREISRRPAARGPSAGPTRPGSSG